ncbi:DsbA family oxidoreductase [Bacillus sp. FJAT-42315]|uniref:DsbA family oxidoreductase n=1 Tax=Bacillus sp. FJAT-42315 TaxID=2014077 RepID=UPI000C24F87F|nr:DsbA family oxidoreductase [Bacillus sp. FJAT-42315]
MKIEIWSDFVCPFCYIGKRRLEKALEQFPHKDEVEVVYKSYELDPNAKQENEQQIHEALAAKYGTSIEQAKQMTENISRQAAEIGLPFNFDNMRSVNTFHAHRLAKYAKDQGKEKEMVERLLKAYFTDSMNVNDQTILVELAKEVGLHEESVQALLVSDRFSEEVRADENLARKLGVQGVPFFVINEKYAISGAQPPEAFLSALQKVWEEENASPVLTDLSTKTTGSTCTDEGCDI